jgi:hypothetical protein
MQFLQFPDLPQHRRTAHNDGDHCGVAHQPNAADNDVGNLFGQFGDY